MVLVPVYHSDLLSALLGILRSMKLERLLSVEWLALYISAILVALLWLLGDPLATVLFYEPGQMIVDIALFERAKIAILFLLTILVPAVAFLVATRYDLGHRTETIAEEMVSDLMLSREQFRMLYENSPMPYFLMDDAGNIRKPNRAALRFLEGTEDQCSIANFFSMLAEDEQAIEAMSLLRAKVDHAVPVSREEMPMRTLQNNVRQVQISIYSLEKKSPIPFKHLVTLVDITAERESEQVKTDFLLLASHQLRTPLTTIKWYVDYLLTSKQMNVQGEVREYLEQVYMGSERMVDLITTLLTVSRIEMGTLAPEYTQVSVKEVVQDILQELNPGMTKKGVTPVLRVVGDDVVVTDRTMIRIAIHNLLTNAMKYSHPDSAIRIEANFGSSAGTITVADRGLGIPLSEQDNIFTKLFRATNARSYSTNGTGLGLYLTKSFVEKLGGTVDFSSEENVGTSFTITMPRIAAEA